MLVIIKDVCDLVAVSARGKRPAAEDPDDKQAAKRGSGAAATAPTGKEALPSVGIAKEWSVTEILQAVAGLLRVLLFISTSRELLEAIKGLGGVGSERCGFRHMLERLLDYRGAAEEFHRFLGKFSALDLEEQPEEEGDDEDDEHEEDEEDEEEEQKEPDADVMDEEDEKEKQKEQDADVMAVVLGVTFGKTSFECSTSQAHHAAAHGLCDMLHVL